MADSTMETRQEPVESLRDLQLAVMRSGVALRAWRIAKAAVLALSLFPCVFAAGQDIDPEALVDMLSEAVKRDAPETVLRLLDGVDAKEFGFSAMHEAAGRDSVRVAQALLDAGYDADLGVDKPLHLAAKHESPRVAALLLEHGAEVSPRDEVGWTPLHYALLEGTARPGLRTANLLLEHGADVNAATTAVGWTPLHLAAHLSGAVVSPNRDEPSGWKVSPRGHGPDVVDIVRKLIERGAAVGARTRVGGWTPARVAKASDEHRRYGLEAGAASKAVLAAIEGAGGEDEGCDDSPRLPAYRGGRTWQDRERQEAAVAPGCEHNLPFAVPGVVFAGGHGVAGSFTAPGADEALLFVGYGIVDGGSWLHLLSLRDRQGVVRPIKAFDHHTDYEGLCLDRETNTHAAVFTRSYDGTCCPEMDTAYYQYDADVGNLVEVFVDVAEQPTGENAECQWRDTAAGAQADDDDDHDPAVEEWLEAFGEVAADTGIRAALDADISFFAETSEQLAAFFRDATVESLEPFLDSEQLLQQAARYADDPSIVTFLIASGFDPNKAFGPTIPAENQYDRRSGERRAGPPPRRRALQRQPRHRGSPGEGRRRFAGDGRLGTCTRRCTTRFGTTMPRWSRRCFAMAHSRTKWPGQSTLRGACRRTSMAMPRCMWRSAKGLDGRSW